MNALPDDPAADLEQIAPMLDEALTKLGRDDRTAIILRFFERRDFRSIGTALGSNEDAARMRVTRALDKLHILLKHRGVTLSAAALGAALATEAATAAHKVGAEKAGYPATKPLDFRWMAAKGYIVLG